MNSESFKSTLKDAHISCLLQYGPHEYAKEFKGVKLPLPREDTDEMLKRLEAKFSRWTGMGFYSYIKMRQEEEKEKKGVDA